MPTDLEFYLAIYGAILSTLLLVNTIYTYYQDSFPKAKVTLSPGFLGVPPYPMTISATIANTGKRPITLNSCGIALSGDKVLFWLLVRDGFPKKLEEGESHIVYRDLEETKQEIIKSGLKPRYFWFKDATGKEYRCNFYKSLTDMLTVKETAKRE